MGKETNCQFKADFPLLLMVIISVMGKKTGQLVVYCLYLVMAC